MNTSDECVRVCEIQIQYYCIMVYVSVCIYVSVYI